MAQRHSFEMKNQTNNPAIPKVEAPEVRPKGRTLLFKIAASTLTSNLTQTLSEMLHQTTNLSKRLLNVESNSTQNKVAISSVASNFSTIPGATPSPKVTINSSKVTLPASTLLNEQGSIAGVGINTFSYSSTSTSITWSWSAFTIYNSDGSSYEVAAGSQIFSGLTSSSTYYFTFYVPVATAVVVVVNQGKTSGLTAAQLAAYNGDGKVLLNYNIAGATPSSGSGGGSGGGGGGGSCFTGNAKLLHGQLISTIKAGDAVTIEREDGSRALRLVEKVIQATHSGLMFHVSDDVWVTPNHLFKYQGVWVRADKLFLVSKHFSRVLVWNLHIRTNEDSERNYVLQNGWCVHNYKPI